MKKESDILGKSKPVLFMAFHLGALLPFITLKLKKFKNRESVLFIRNSDFLQTEFANRLLEHKIFSKIIYFDEPLFIKTEEGELQHEVLNHYSKLFNDNNIDIKAFYKVLIACDVQNYFYFYCKSYNAPMVFVEWYDKQFEDESRYDVNRVCAHSPVWLENLSKKYRILTGDEDCVQERYLFSKSKRKFSKDQTIDFLNEYYSLTAEDKECMLSVLCVKKEVEFKNCNLLLLNSIGWSQFETKLSLPKHYLPYLLIADYFFDNNFTFIKDHPQTPNKYFKETISKYASTLNAEIPIEFYGLIKGFHVNKMVSVDSTGGTKIRQFVEQEIKLGRAYLRNYILIHKMYVTYFIDKLIGKSNAYHIYNLDKDFVTCIKNNIFEPFEKNAPDGIKTDLLKGDSFIVIHHASHMEANNLAFALKNADINTKVVFHNIDFISIISQDNLDLLDNFIKIVIHKQNLRDDILCDLNDEIMYFFCKDKNVREKVLNINFEKELYHSGIKIFLDRNLKEKNLSYIQQIKIEVLNRIIQVQNDKLKKIKDLL